MESRRERQAVADFNRRIDDELFLIKRSQFIARHVLKQRQYITPITLRSACRDAAFDTHKHFIKQALKHQPKLP